MSLVPAPVTWAMRPDSVFLTICVQDCKDVTLDITETKVYFKGTGGSDNKTYENTIELYEAIDAEKSIKHVRGRNIEILLVRKESGPYWPHLLKSKVKQHWLKVDFLKWKDEDDDDEDTDAAGGGQDKYSDLFSQMNMGGMGGGMPGMDGGPSLDDLGDGNETDSDDEQLPDLE